MTTFRKKTGRIAAIVLTAALIFSFAAPGAAFAATADPDALLPPGVFDPAEGALAALREQIASLEKIIELNVPRADKIPVLLYHHLAREDELTPSDRNNDFVMSVEKFSEQMKYLYDNNYYTASLYELERYINGKVILPEKTVVITFDDGYRSNTKYAYPILKKYDFRAAIFIVSSLIGEKVNVIERANWGDLKNCKDVFSYHSHSHNLHQQQRDGKSSFVVSDSSVIANDILISKALLSTSYIAYPYGQTSRAVKKALSESGYRMGFTTVAEYVKRKSDAYEVPRFTITPQTSQDVFEAIVTGKAGPAAAAAATTVTYGEP